MTLCSWQQTRNHITWKSGENVITPQTGNGKMAKSKIFVRFVKKIIDKIRIFDERKKAFLAG